MTDFATARAAFLARVDNYFTGLSTQFAPALDELIQWSTERGMAFDTTSTTQASLRFRKVGERATYWMATPRVSDGGKLTIDGPELFVDEVRETLARIDGSPVDPKRPPSVAFSKLIWKPYRADVLNAIGKVLAGGPVTEPNLAETRVEGMPLTGL